MRPAIRFCSDGCHHLGWRQHALAQHSMTAPSAPGSESHRHRTIVIENTGYVRDYGTIVRNQHDGFDQFVSGLGIVGQRPRSVVDSLHPHLRFLCPDLHTSDFTQFIDQTPTSRSRWSHGCRTQRRLLRGATVVQHTLYPAGIYTARLMTNELTSSSRGLRISPTPPRPPPSGWFRQSGSARIFHQLTIVRGTTGRTARVWSTTAA